MALTLPPKQLAPIAYTLVGGAVFRRLAVKEKVPAAQLELLVSIYVLGENQLLPPSSSDINEAKLMSRPLMRSYIRSLEAKGYLRQERIFQNGPRWLRLTVEGTYLAKRCVGALHTAARAFLGQQFG